MNNSPLSQIILTTSLDAPCAQVLQTIQCLQRRLNGRKIVLAIPSENASNLDNPPVPYGQTMDFYRAKGLPILGTVFTSNFPQIASLDNPPIVVLEVNSPDELTHGAPDMAENLQKISQKSLLVVGPNATKALLAGSSTQTYLGLVPFSMVNGNHCSAYIECNSTAIYTYGPLGQNEPVEDIIRLRERCATGFKPFSRRQGAGFGGR